MCESFLGDEAAGELMPKGLLALAEEPEFNEEICRLARWQRQGISAADMAGRRKVFLKPPPQSMHPARGRAPQIGYIYRSLSQVGYIYRLLSQVGYARKPSP